MKSKRMLKISEVADILGVSTSVTRDGTASARSTDSRSTATLRPAERSVSAARGSRCENFSVSETRRVRARRTRFPAQWNASVSGLMMR